MDAIRVGFTIAGCYCGVRRHGHVQLSLLFFINFLNYYYYYLFSVSTWCKTREKYNFSEQE